MNWNQALFTEMAATASKAPSVHNVQPWKIRFTENGFDLFQSTERRLHVGDPRLHDNDVSLGAFIELCSMFLRHNGFQLTSSPLASEKIGTLESRFRFNVSISAVETDPLFQFISKRKSYRGIFSDDQPIDIESLKKIHIPGLQVQWITGKDEMKKWAQIYDESSAHINKNPGYFKELVHWLRFSEKHPSFNEDGLNYKSLALGKPEAVMGNLLFNVPFFKLLSLLKMEKVLITEAPQIRSAQGIFVIFASQELNSIEMGRAFIRFWLTLTSLGISVCPLSALVDFTGSLNILNKLKPSDATICLNVLRFGKVADEKTIYSSPRLSVERIMLK